MRQILLLANLILLINCSPSKHLEGTWYLTGLPQSLTSNFRTFIDFKQDTFHWVTFGDLSTADYSKIIVQKGTYNLKNSHLSFKNGTKIKFTVRDFGDSLILKSKQIGNDYLVIGKLNPELKCYSTNEDFAGKSFVAEYFDFKDSICFINDSIQISTGEYDINSPIRKWEINYLNGFSFLNIHSAIIPLRFINISQSGELTLIHVAQNQKQIVLKPTYSIINPSDLYGKWKEIENGASNSPLPPGLQASDRTLRLEIEADSMNIKYYRRDETVKWNLTNDGKRIYFLDKLSDKEMGTWKIVSLSPDALVLRFTKSRHALDEKVFTLEKVHTF